MSDDEDLEVMKILGITIANCRKHQHLSQSELADGICSQSMISSIEKGKYIPNVVLLSKLCNRLNISVDNALLSNYPEIEKQADFNQTIKTMCDNHKYDDMFNYLNQDKTLKLLKTDQDFQTYYYYLGVSNFQANHDINSALKNLKLSYQYSFKPNSKKITPMEILIQSAIGYLIIKNGAIESGVKIFDETMNKVANHLYTKYDENINILFYQYGSSLLDTGFNEAAIEIFSQGITWTTQHSSTYMLSDLFFGLSKAFKQNNQAALHEEALLKSKMLSDIYSTSVYDQS